MSVHGEKGLAPGIDTDAVLSAIPSLTDRFYIDAELLMSICSPNVQPENWLQIARRIHRSQADYDGVVVIHGTDTLAYTSSALSFMLGNVQIPVVVTGSQIPLQDDTTDAKRNIVDSCVVASSGAAGVMVVFGGKIIRGSRASKISSGAIEAFSGINYPDLGLVNDQRALFYDQSSLSHPGGVPELFDHICARVAVLKIIPGIGGSIFDLFEDSGYRGLVIESVGKGGLPTNRPELLQKLKQTVLKGVPVAITTQCTFQGTNLDLYKNGRETLDTGAIPTYDMSIEAVVTKLMWILGKTDQLPMIRRMMLHNYAGELNFGVSNKYGILSA